METLSLEQVYREYHDRIYRMIRKKILDPVTAEDLTSDVFAKIAKHLDRYDPEKAGISTWVYTIANRTLTDYYRTRRIHIELPQESGENGVLPSVLVEEEEPGQELYFQEQLEELAKALKLLPERERDLIILHYYHGLTLKVIAQKMGMSYANAKVVHKKALNGLKSCLEER